MRLRRAKNDGRDIEILKFRMNHYVIRSFYITYNLHDSLHININIYIYIIFILPSRLSSLRFISNTIRYFRYHWIIYTCNCCCLLVLSIYIYIYILSLSFFLRTSQIIANWTSRGKRSGQLYSSGDQRVSIGWPYSATKTIGFYSCTFRNSDLHVPVTRYCLRRLFRASD